MALLEVKDLHVTYERHSKPDVQAVRDISFTVNEGETVGIVGESGCGKSTVAKALMRGLPDNGQISGGTIRFGGADLTQLSIPEIKEYRWDEISMISQSAMASLNPVYSIGTQINEAIQTHESDVSKEEGFERARELLDIVDIDPDRVHDYPHQLSGGMRQRAIIAMSMALDPRLIIADEPTTALDVIVQKQILSQIRSLQEESGSSMLMITHDISVVAEMCDRVLVMYGGEIMEEGTTDQIFNDAYHPYTLGLQNAFPSIEGEKQDLISIPGSPPDLSNPPSGCPFQARCPYSEPACESSLPVFEPEDRHRVRCHEPHPFKEIRQTAGDRTLWQETGERQEVSND